MKLHKFLQPHLEDLEEDTDWQYRILRFLGSNRSTDRGHIERNSKLCSKSGNGNYIISFYIKKNREINSLLGILYLVLFFAVVFSWNLFDSIIRGNDEHFGFFRQSHSPDGFGFCDWNNVQKSGLETIFWGFPPCHLESKYYVDFLRSFREIIRKNLKMLISHFFFFLNLWNQHYYFCSSYTLNTLPSSVAA